MLHAGETFGGVVVLVVNVQVVVAHSLASLVAEQIVIDEGFRCLAGKLHHHAGWRVGIHVSVFASDIIILGIDNLQEDVASLGLSSHAALVAVVDIAFSHLLAGALHELQLYHVLNTFHAHLALAPSANVVGDALDKRLIVARVGSEHSFANSGFNLFLVVSNDASITLYNSLNHSLF